MLHSKLALQDRARPMLKPMAIMFAVVGVVFAGLYGFVSFRSAMIKQFLGSMANPPQTVSVATASVQDWRPKLTAIGTFRAVNGADLALESSGVVEKIQFQSGQDVTAGQLLLELRKDTDLAKLASLKATAELTEITLRRDQAQLKIHATSQATVDTDLANLKSAQAQVAEQEAVIAQKTLRAPFAGRLGIRFVDLGQYVSAGATIVTLQALDPIYLDFVLPQQALDGIKVGQTIQASVDTFAGQTFAGTIAAVNSKVDQSSRNIQVRASVANNERKLLPGMFASIEISIGQTERFVTLPQTAIVYAPYGNSVFLAENGKQIGKDASPAAIVARQTFVQLGGTRGDQVAVLSGLPEGASVVTAGQLKLKNGTPLHIDNSVQPTADANPLPVDR
jgi:membrane fusion protein (multidrug efflux system)